MLIERTIRFLAIAIALFAFLEILSWMTKSIPPCLIEARDNEESSQYDDNTQCPTFYVGTKILVARFDSFMERHDKSIIASFTIVLAISTIGLWLATRQLFEAGEKQFLLAQQEFISIQRPKIRVKHVWLLTKFSRETPIIGHVECVNEGTGDATVFEYGTKFYFLKLGDFLPRPSDFTPIRVVAIIGPGSHWGAEIQHSLTEDEEVSVSEGRVTFIFAGYFHYIDRLGRYRTTAFCRALISPADRRLRPFDDPDYEYET